MALNRQDAEREAARQLGTRFGPRIQSLTTPGSGIPESPTYIGPTFADRAEKDRFEALVAQLMGGADSQQTAPTRQQLIQRGFSEGQIRSMVADGQLPQSVLTNLLPQRPSPIAQPPVSQPAVRTQTPGVLASPPPAPQPTISQAPRGDSPPVEGLPLRPGFTGRFTAADIPPPPPPPPRITSGGGPVSQVTNPISGVPEVNRPQQTPSALASPQPATQGGSNVAIDITQEQADFLRRNGRSLDGFNVRGTDPSGLFSPPVTGGGGGDLGIGGDQDIGGGGIGDGQVGDRLSKEEILTSLRDGDIVPEAAVDLLVQFGHFQNSRQARNFIVQNQASEPLPEQGGTADEFDAFRRRGNTGAIGPGRDVLETGINAEPVTRAELLENLQPGEAARGVALDTGVSPSFRNFVTGRLQAQFQPFATEAALGNEAFNPEDVQTSDFVNFLRSRGTSGFGRTGDLLGRAASFLGRDNADDESLALRQNFIRSGFEKEGAVGFDRFSPLINDFVLPGASRAAPGLGGRFKTALRSSLQNSFARNPLQFENSEGFIDSLRRQGLVR